MITENMQILPEGNCKKMVWISPRSRYGDKTCNKFMTLYNTPWTIHANRPGTVIKDRKNRIYFFIDMDLLVVCKISCKIFINKIIKIQASWSGNLKNLWHVNINNSSRSPRIYCKRFGQIHWTDSWLPMHK